MVKAHFAPDRRFLRARKFDLKQAKTMLVNCQHWRKTVEDVGIDELYRQIDPFDVSSIAAVSAISDHIRQL